MNITLGTFEIANGDDRTAQVLSEETVTMQQRTQVEVPSRAAWAVAFPERASRTIPLTYQVTCPPCETYEDALLQSRSLPASCPAGGVLVEYHNGVRITYASAWVNDIQARRTGVSNAFTFGLLATNPTVEELILDADGEIFTDATDGEEFTY